MGLTLTPEDAQAAGLVGRKHLSGWATVWTWSIRPDIWPPGRYWEVWLMAGDHRTAPVAHWAEDWPDVLGQMAWAPTEPGVVEAAILADEVATRSW